MKLKRALTNEQKQLLNDRKADIYRNEFNALHKPTMGHILLVDRVIESIKASAINGPQKDVARKLLRQIKETATL